MINFDYPDTAAAGLTPGEGIQTGAEDHVVRCPRGRKPVLADRLRAAIQFEIRNTDLSERVTSLLVIASASLPTSGQASQSDNTASGPN